MNYQQWLQQAIMTLTPYSSSPRCDAEALLSHMTQQSRATLLAFSETLLSQPRQQALSDWLTRRVQGEPIAYLTGEREFWSLPLQVTPATLIPRPETELLVEQALQRLPQTACQLLDLGTGSGAIALVLAKERPDCQIIATDCCQQALAVAQHNAQCLQLTNVRFLQGDWFAPLARQRFQMIISNPPYLDTEDPHWQQGDLRFEPRQALVAAEQGLAALQQIIRQAADYLLPSGWLLVEHGWQQGEAVATQLQQAGYRQVATLTDLAKHPRISLGQWPNV
ncbi:MAG: peptide chain release factor N(5)-glutamine methyltransferase [Candidatus Symbiodolus clandestinus]